MDQDERDEILRRFRAAVNMEPEDLASWLKTAPSRPVGWPKDRAPGVESVGHASGRRILQILGAPEAALTEDDYRHMRNVAGYVARHLKQRPLRDVTHTRWRWSLMNRGHDPVRRRGRAVVNDPLAAPKIPIPISQKPAIGPCQLTVFAKMREKRLQSGMMCHAR